MARPTSIALALALSLGLSACCGEAKTRASAEAGDPPSTRARVPDPIEVDARDLYKTYARHHQGEARHGAWQTWRNKALVLRGEVVRKGPLVGGYELALRGDGEGGEVVCAMRLDQFEQAEALNIGQTATLRGTGDGWLVGPHLRDCQIPPSN